MGMRSGQGRRPVIRSSTARSRQSRHIRDPRPCARKGRYPGLSHCNPVGRSRHFLYRFDSSALGILEPELAVYKPPLNSVASGEVAHLFPEHVGSAQPGIRPEPGTLHPRRSSQPEIVWQAWFLPQRQGLPFFFGDVRDRDPGAFFDVKPSRPMPLSPPVRSRSCRSEDRLLHIFSA